MRLLLIFALAIIFSAPLDALARGRCRGHRERGHWRQRSKCGRTVHRERGRRVIRSRGCSECGPQQAPQALPRRRAKT